MAVRHFRCDKFSSKRFWRWLKEDRQKHLTVSSYASFIPQSFSFCLLNRRLGLTGWRERKASNRIVNNYFFGFTERGQTKAPNRIISCQMSSLNHSVVPLKQTLRTNSKRERETWNRIISKGCNMQQKEEEIQRRLARIFPLPAILFNAFPLCVS